MDIQYTMCLCLGYITVWNIADQERDFELQGTIMHVDCTHRSCTTVLQQPTMMECMQYSTVLVSCLHIVISSEFQAMLCCHCVQMAIGCVHVVGMV